MASWYYITVNLKLGDEYLLSLRTVREQWALVFTEIFPVNKLKRCWHSGTWNSVYSPSRFLYRSMQAIRRTTQASQTDTSLCLFCGHNCVCALEQRATLSCSRTFWFLSGYKYCCSDLRIHRSSFTKLYESLYPCFEEELLLEFLYLRFKS